MVIGPVVFTVQLDGEPSAIKAVKTKLRRVSSPAAPPKPPGAKYIDDEEEEDPISALEALASSADQTAINPFDEDELT